MVISDKIQENREESRCFFNNEQAKDRRRTGMPTSLASADMGLSTVIARTEKDASGYGIKPSMVSTMNRLRTWDFRTQASSDRNLRFAFNELHTLKDKLGLPDAIIEKTAYIYRKAQQRGLARGRSVSTLLAAAIYVACRQMGVPRTLDDIAARSRCGDLISGLINVEETESRARISLTPHDMDLSTVVVKTDSSRNNIESSASYCIVIAVLKLHTV